MSTNYIKLSKHVLRFKVLRFNIDIFAILRYSVYNKENVNSFGSLYVLLGNNESEINQFHTGGGSFCTRLF